MSHFYIAIIKKQQWDKLRTGPRPFLVPEVVGQMLLSLCLVMCQQLFLSLPHQGERRDKWMKKSFPCFLFQFRNGRRMRTGGEKTAIVGLTEELARIYYWSKQIAWTQTIIPTNVDFISDIAQHLWCKGQMRRLKAFTLKKKKNSFLLHSILEISFILVCFKKSLFQFGYISLNFIWCTKRRDVLSSQGEWACSSHEPQPWFWSTGSEWAE